jgi:hypothetical protein
MIRKRLVAGAVLMALLCMSPAFADKVDVITPGGGGSTGFAPSTTDDEKGATGLAERPRRDTGGGSSFDPAQLEAQPGLQTMHFGGVSLSCKVASTATDLVVVNDSLEPLPPGTRIKWQLKAEGQRGYFAIIGELGGGQSLVADDVLDGKAAPDDTCVARVI